MSTETTSVIDREKQCPFLLRVFYGPGEKPRESEITSSEAPELQIYTWKDATLGEISLAIKKAIPDMIAQAGPGCLLEFRHMTVEADRSSYTGRDIGTVRLDQVLSISNTRSAPDQEGGISTRDIHSNVKDSNRRSDRPNKSYEKSLKMVRHEPGDFLTVAVASVRPGFISANTRFSLENPPGRSGRGGGGDRRDGRGGSGRDGRGGSARDGRGASGRDGGRRGDRDGGPIRNGRSGGGRQDRDRRDRRDHRGRGGVNEEPIGGRLAGRLSGGDSSRNGHGQGFGSRMGPLDVEHEPSWKGRGRGR